MTGPRDSVSAVEESELWRAAWGLQLGENPATVGLYMELWVWEYECVGRRLRFSTWADVLTTQSLEETNVWQQV